MRLLALAVAIRDSGGDVLLKYSKALKKALRKLLKDSDLRFVMAKKASEIVDGQGAKRVLSALKRVRK